MTLTEPRLVYAPFEYPEAEAFWLKQQQAHWLHTEISLATDIHDWSTKLTDAERQIVGSVLKGFTQTEVVVNDYWSRQVSAWFPKPEIVSMASTFAAMETIHARAYAYLNESLGLDDFAAFLDEPTAAAKISALLDVPGGSPREIARSLAIFSAFTEGVQLFSSFAILLNFQQHNKLKGLGQIISFSLKDESLHSEAGCWLFRQFVSENPSIWDKELRRDVYEAARAAVALEDDFIDKAFELGPAEGLEADYLKAYIRARANAKLQDLGLASNWRNIDQKALSHMTWFDYMTRGQEHQDFFAGRETGYSKGVGDFSDIFDD